MYINLYLSTTSLLQKEGFMKTEGIYGKIWLHVKYSHLILFQHYEYNRCQVFSWFIAEFKKEKVTGLITLHLFSIPHRVSNDCLDHVYHSVMSQLNQEHAEIRLSAFQIASELFARSHHFRMLLVDNFQVNQLLVTSNHLRSSSVHQTLQDLAFYWQNKASDGIL